MKTSLLVKCALVGVGLPLLAGCVTREVVYRDRPAPAPVVTEEEAPAAPPPQVEIAPAPPGSLTAWYWAPGCWEWRGRWVWTSGHWITRPSARAVWVAPHWGLRNHHRVWVPGTWR